MVHGIRGTDGMYGSIHHSILPTYMDGGLRGCCMHYTGICMLDTTFHGYYIMACIDVCVYGILHSRIPSYGGGIGIPYHMVHTMLYYELH